MGTFPLPVYSHVTYPFTNMDVGKFAYMHWKSSPERNNNNKCNQNKDAALLTLKPAQGQSTKSGHGHEFRHGGDGYGYGDGDGDDVEDASGKRPTKAKGAANP
ncbi:LOW QUALITY PROTEIN: uncharacterized protein [Drosophila bipectinata]|uniref:LOW QUALITY PROTEIN: uncharacterized protein n=1 Tax=Drosophila bipectinata TaxID=42026 RepID=UPI0038B2DFE3